MHDVYSYLKNYKFLYAHILRAFSRMFPSLWGRILKQLFRPSICVCLSVSLSLSPSFCVSQCMYSNSRTTKRIFIKLNFGEFYKKKLPISLNFNFYCTILTTALHEELDLPTFQYVWNFVSLTCICAFLSLPSICTFRIMLWKNTQVRKIKLHSVYFKLLGTKTEISCFSSFARVKIWTTHDFSTVARTFRESNVS